MKNQGNWMGHNQYSIRAVGDKAFIENFIYNLATNFSDTSMYSDEE